MRKLKIDFNAPVVLILYSLLGEKVLHTLGIHYSS